MLGMVSYSRRLKSGQIMCYLNRTYHVLLTAPRNRLAKPCLFGIKLPQRAKVRTPTWGEQMFRIITVEREYGAGGAMVAAELARRKGWQLVDQEITAEIAKLASVDSRVVARCEEKCDNLMHRLCKVFWRGSYERSLPIADDKIFNADMVVHLAQRVIEEKAKQGH